MKQSSLAETLRVLRAREDLTIKEAASRIGITRETLRDLEHGTRNPYYPTLEKIAQAYNVTVEELMLPAAGEEPVLSGKAPAPPDTEASEEERRSQRIVDMSQDEFLSEVSAAESDEDLRELFNRVDAERTHLELVWREDEGNYIARQAYARSVQRRMVILLALYERGIAPRRPSGADLEELAKVLESG